LGAKDLNKSITENGSILTDFAAVFVIIGVLAAFMMPYLKTRVEQSKTVKAFKCQASSQAYREVVAVNETEQ
jgi:hypothetical protein